MKEYHKNWLAAHPHRSEEWFKDKMKDGFDIHHMDGNPANNDPSNLVMIEAADHMELHGFGRVLHRFRPIRRKPTAKTQKAYGRVYDSPIGPKSVYIYAKPIGPPHIWIHKQTAPMGF